VNLTPDLFQIEQIRDPRLKSREVSLLVSCRRIAIILIYLETSFKLRGIKSILTLVLMLDNLLLSIHRNKFQTERKKEIAITTGNHWIIKGEFAKVSKLSNI
jgi:hypothetical protein